MGKTPTGPAPSSGDGSHVITSGTDKSNDSRRNSSGKKPPAMRLDANVVLGQQRGFKSPQLTQTQPQPQPQTSAQPRIDAKRLGKETEGSPPLLQNSAHVSDALVRAKQQATKPYLRTSSASVTTVMTQSSVNGRKAAGRHSAVTSRPKSQEGDDEEVAYEADDNTVVISLPGKNKDVRFGMEELERVRRLGSGASGEVSLVKYRDYNFACKVVNVSLSNVSNLQRELSILKRVNPCPRLVHYFGFCKSKGQVHLFLEYMERGTLKDIMQAAGGARVPESALAYIAREALLGLSFLHVNLGVVHRDIKPSNILVGSQWEVKLCDFGVSKEWSLSQQKDTYIGSIKYMAPERIDSRIAKGKSDALLPPNSKHLHPTQARILQQQQQQKQQHEKRQRSRSGGDGVLSSSPRPGVAQLSAASMRRSPRGEGVTLNPNGTGGLKKVRASRGSKPRSRSSNSDSRRSSSTSAGSKDKAASSSEPKGKSPTQESASDVAQMSCHEPTEHGAQPLSQVDRASPVTPTTPTRCSSSESLTVTPTITAPLIPEDDGTMHAQPQPQRQQQQRQSGSRLLSNKGSSCSSDTDSSSEQQAVDVSPFASPTTRSMRKVQRQKAAERTLFKGDCWSLGCTLAEVWYGKYPYPNEGALSLKLQCTIVNSDPPIPPSPPLSRPFARFFKDCLVVNPDKRLSCRSLLEKHKKLLTGPHVAEKALERWVLGRGATPSRSSSLSSSSSSSSLAPQADGSKRSASDS